LKPDKAATTIDRAFISLESGSIPNIWDTYSNISGHVWHYVLAAELQSDFTLYPNDLFPPISTLDSGVSYRAFNWNTPRQQQIFMDEYPIQLKANNGSNWPFIYYVMVPILPNDFFVIGEIEKYVTMSSQRFDSIELDTSSLQVVIQGDINEVVSVMIGHTGCSTRYQQINCTIAENKSALLSCKYTGSIDCIC